MSNTGPATPIRDLASLQARIKDDEALTPARRAAVCSAINVACRWIALPPAMVPAQVAYLSAKLEPIEPAAAGVTRKRFATVKSDVLLASPCGLRRQGHGFGRDVAGLASTVGATAGQICANVHVAAVPLLLGSGDRARCRE